MTTNPVRNTVANEAFITQDVALPMPPKIMPRRPLPSYAPGEKFRVLVVEDDSNIARLILANLSKMGMECRYAADGETALRAWHEIDPHLMLLDLLMPGMDGYTVCSLIRRRSAMPIIMVTGRDEVENQLHSFKIGADDYIAKPFEVKIFVARVVALLRRTYRYNSCECVLANLETQQRISAKSEPDSPQNLPKGWACCESCHYMGPSTAFKGSEPSGREISMCPHCRSTVHISFGIA